MSYVNHAVVARRATNRSGRIRVVIADPDECLQAAYRELLSEEVKLVVASDGVECVARLRERVPDLLVLEPQLPCGGGDRVLAIMHEVPELALVPVMILTSCRDVRVLNRVAAFRISDYCAKPQTPSQLLARIRNVLHYRSLHGDTPLKSHPFKRRAVTAAGKWK